MVYIAYKIWLSRNSLVFDAQVVPARRVMERASSLASKYSHFDSVDPTLDPSPWGSLAEPVVLQRTLLISWEPPSFRFVKVNFDGDVRDGRGSLGFVIRDLDLRLLAAGGSSFFEASVLGAELRAA